MAERTTDAGLETDGPVAGTGRGSPQPSPGRNRKRRSGIEIVLDPNAPDAPKPERVSKAGLIKKSATRRNKANVTERVAGKLGDVRKPEQTGGGNSGYKVPDPLPFESTLAYAFRSSGGKITAINGARLVDDERFKKLVWAYDHSPIRDQQLVILEDLCGAADITPDEFLGEVLACMWRRSIDIGKLTAIAAHPRIVEATIIAAEGQWGNADRRMLLDHANFLPKAAGQTINVGVDARTNVAVVTEGGRGLPSFEDEGKKLHTAMRKEFRQLEASAEPITIPIQEAEFVDVPSNKDSL